MHELLSIRNELCVPGRIHNARAALLYTSRWFLFWVEGDDEAVDEWLRRAAADPRNAHQKLLHRSRGPATLVEPITVSTTQCPLRPTHFAHIVTRLAKQPHASPQPEDIWRLFAAPSVHGSPHEMVRPARHAVVASADDNRTTEHLRRLGDCFDEPLVYRRFSTARQFSTDIGLAYVDVPLPEGTGRVHAVSRRAMEHPLIRRIVPRLDALILLPGERPAQAIEIVSAAADALRATGLQPAVVVTGATDEVAAACARLLMAAGQKRVLRGDVEALADLLPMLGWQLGAHRGNSVGPPAPTHGWAHRAPLPTIPS